MLVLQSRQEEGAEPTSGSGCGCKVQGVDTPQVQETPIGSSWPIRKPAATRGAEAFGYNLTFRQNLYLILIFFLVWHLIGKLVEKVHVFPTHIRGKIGFAPSF
ncbi:hypothetical protein PG996_013476 [Apiospora saccharicola]|uniref:Uncharacterized protein n=1 Tax=Apiospora saccharicola TaxID=335842 RepID=A0ABR1U5L0_9PEZI